MRKLLIVPVCLAAVFAGGAVRIMQDQCGPFTDVTPAFCPYILELYYLGITAGTSATTFSPDDPLTRGQAAVFIAKGLNQSLARSSRRAALGQWWTPQGSAALGGVDIGAIRATFDGADLWVSSAAVVYRIRASSGAVLETWTGALGARSVLVAMGRVFISGDTNPGSLYMIDPTQPPGAVTTVATDLGTSSRELAFDGSRIWSLNFGGISLITPSATLPWPVVNVPFDATMFSGITFDGSNMWASDFQTVKKFDSNGAVIQTVSAGDDTRSLLFDGKNLWVIGAVMPTVGIIDASTGVGVAGATGNGLNNPTGLAFDGRRILVLNQGNNTVSIFDAASLSPLGSVPVGATPQGACSDGVNFWIAAGSRLIRF